jgi:hypothetical protein
LYGVDPGFGHAEETLLPGRPVAARGGHREPPEVPIHVRLVVVAAALRDRRDRQLALGAEQRGGPLEADDRRRGLRGDADLSAKAGDQVPAAAAEPLGKRADLDPAAAGEQRAPRPLDARRGPAGAREAAARS